MTAKRLLQFVMMISMIFAFSANNASAADNFVRLSGDAPMWVVQPPTPAVPTYTTKKPSDPASNGAVAGLVVSSAGGSITYCFAQLTKQDPVTGWRTTVAYANCVSGGFVIESVPPGDYTLEIFSNDHSLDRRPVSVTSNITTHVGTITLAHHMVGFKLIVSLRENILEWDIFMGNSFPNPKKFIVNGVVFAPGANWLGLNIPVRQTASAPGPHFANKIALPPDILPGSTVCVTVDLAPGNDRFTVLTNGHGLCFQAPGYAVGQLTW